MQFLMSRLQTSAISWSSFSACRNSRGFPPEGPGVIDNINNNLPIAHLFRFERSNDSIPPRPPYSARAPSRPQPDYKSVGFGQQISCRDLDKIALTVPSGNPVLFAIFRAPIPASWFSERTVRTVSSGRDGLPSLLPLARATLSPALVRSDIRALSCLASVANIEIITSLNGPVESSHCS